MSCGFHRHPAFEVVGAADAEIGKPARDPERSGATRRSAGTSAWNRSRSISAPSGGGVARPPRAADRPPCSGVRAMYGLLADARAQPPRRRRAQLARGRVATFARVLRPEVIVMENARELLMGRFAGHFGALARSASRTPGYRVVRRDPFPVGLRPAAAPRARAHRRRPRGSSGARPERPLGRASPCAPGARPSGARSAHLPQVRRRYRPRERPDARLAESSSREQTPGSPPSRTTAAPGSTCSPPR